MRRRARPRCGLIEVSDLVVFGNVHITTPALAALLEREIPVTFLSYGGWFRGIAHGIGHRNVELRMSTDIRKWTLFDIENWTPCCLFGRETGRGRLVQVVHRRDPRAAQRPSRVWRSSAREEPVHPPGQALVMPVLARSVRLPALSTIRPGASRASGNCRRGS
jgi:CRISPR associated protein, Cas1 family